MCQIVASAVILHSDRHTERPQHPWSQRQPGAADALEDGPRVQRQLLCRLHVRGLPAAGAVCISNSRLIMQAPVCSHRLQLPRMVMVCRCAASHAYVRVAAHDLLTYSLVSYLA
jgi:hypothetical protein